MTVENCACGSGKTYADCCERFISGREKPSTPEDLMRSRYTAYTKANIDYIARTMKSPASDHFDPPATENWAKRVQWLRLEVMNASKIEHGKGFVEFAAHYSMNHTRQVMHEISEFHLQDGLWYYVDGKAPRARVPITVTRVGRNDPCLCGSGNKYKKCCGKAILS